MAKEKVEKQEEKVISPEEQLNSYLKANKEHHFNFDDRISWKSSTGSLLLDSELGPVMPSMWRLVGHNNEGKTPECLEIIRNFLNDVPESRGVYVLAEGRLSDENKNRCGLTFVTNPEEWRDGTIFLFECNIYEAVIGLFRDLVKNNPNKKKYAFCLDSLDGLILKDDQEKTAEEAHKVAGPQLLTKKMFQNISLGMFKTGNLMLMTSQVTASPKIDPYAKVIHRDGNFSGGSAASHWADVVLEFQPSYNSDFILDNPNGKLNDGKSKAIGKWCKVTIIKTTMEKSKRQTVTYPIKFGRKPSGIWLEYEICDLLVMWGILTRPTGKGAWYDVDPKTLAELKDNKLEMPAKFQGLDSVREFLEENQPVTQFLYSKFRKLMIH